MGYGFYYGFDSSFLILIPAIIFSVVAQISVSTSFSRWSGVRNDTGITGVEAARRMLEAHGLTNVDIQQISGNLSDHYDPRSITLNLSSSVYGRASVASVGVACHEVGHAIQHAEEYGPLKVRNAIVPVVSFASHAAWILIILGFVLMAAESTGSTIGYMMVDIGIICFVAVIGFHLVTLPVELDASRRAMAAIREMGLVGPGQEKGARSVLRAAAMTYVAALAVSIANLLRILLIRGRRS